MAAYLQMSPSEGILQKSGIGQFLTKNKGAGEVGRSNASGQEQTNLCCSTKTHVLKAELRTAGQAWDKGAKRHRNRSLPKRRASKTRPGKPRAEKMRSFAKALVSEVSSTSPGTLPPDAGAEPQRNANSKKNPYGLGKLTIG